MFWELGLRQTRRGTIFSPHSGPATQLHCKTFDFAPLLAEAVKREGVEDADEEHHPELPPNPMNSVDDEYLPPPPSDSMNEVDDEYLPPPPYDPMNDVDDLLPLPQTPRAPSPRRTAFDDMRDGKKPLSRSHRKRQEKRARTKTEEGHAPRPFTLRKHVRPALVKPLRAAINANLLPAARGAYAAKVADGDELYGRKKRRTLDELVGLGFQIIEWNGFDSRPLVDAYGRVFAVLVGQPRGLDWAAAINEMYGLVTKEGAAASFPYRMRSENWRGLFAALNVGLSYGKGQTVPSRLLNKNYTPLLDRLLSNAAIMRMAHFASAAFQLWAPRLYDYYRDHNEALHAHLPNLRCNFPRSILLAVEFPHSALILVPSATIAHSNVPVQAGDKHISFTQFTAGGLMRFVDNGFQTEDDLKATDLPEYERLEGEKDLRWAMGLGLLSTIDDLVEASGAETVDELVESSATE
ncbi:hypothetical protein FB451DRAFT_1401859 [Mycena latifolia]|nr:hypothetical protein FB451DRAFT_1401859 [Mycena latifolia]